MKCNSMDTVGNMCMTIWIILRDMINSDHPAISQNTIPEANIVFPDIFMSVAQCSCQKLIHLHDIMSEKVDYF